VRDVVRVFSAGSLRHAMPEIAAAFEEETGIAVSLELGPAGLLRERIEAGEPFDLFASANMAHPERLVSLGFAREATCFARNRLAIIARADLGLTAETIADVLSKPSIRIGTSTPGDDPSGDYAFAMFDLLDAGYPGLGKGLKARALQLVGGRHSSPGRSATSLIADGTVDLFLSYASNARLHESDPRFSVTQLPAYLSPDIAYGMALGRASGSIAKELHTFLLTDRAQILLVKNGFLPRVCEAVESGR